MNDSEILDLLERYRNDDQDAGNRLLAHYFERLVRYVGGQIRPGLRRHIDGDDLAASALESFIRRNGAEPFAIESAGHLWELLRGIVRMKLKTHIRRATTRKRDVEREVGSLDGAPIAAMDRAPTSSEEAYLNEEWNLLVGGLRAPERAILEMHLAGAEVPEISRAVARSEGRVRHVLSDVARALERRLSDDSSVVSAI